LAVGCALIGLVEWYALEHGVRKLVCGIVSEPGEPVRCARPWEPRPMPWFAAAIAFGSVALIGAVRIELHGWNGRVDRLVLGS
jgi:hypothetical protein